MTTADLSGARLKIERARGHISELKHLVADSLSPSLYRFAPERDPNTGELVYRVHTVPEVPAEIPLILGEILYNLRSALDHLAWQIALFDGKTPDENTKFPIRDNPFAKDDRWKAAQISPGIENPILLDELERCQPYRDLELGKLQPFTKSRLWQLRVLNNIDKHRVLLVTVIALNTSEMWWGMPPDQPSPRIRLFWGPACDGEPVAWFDFQGHEPPSDFDPHLSLHVAMRERAIPEAARWDLGRVMTALVFDVENIVAWRFAPIFDRGSPLT